MTVVVLKMLFLEILLVGVIGLILGSFISSLTYRLSCQAKLPQGEGVYLGRSFCVNCKRSLSWWHNIPLISFLILGGRCGFCGKRISARYPLIESTTALLFIAFFLFITNCSFTSGVCVWKIAFGEVGALFFAGFVQIVLVATLVIDIERRVIFDEFILILLFLAFVAQSLAAPDTFYASFLAGFLGSMFLLLIYAVTGARGMGLGDVKLIFPLIALLGASHAIPFIFLSFIVGGVVAIGLLVFGKARLGEKIAFGPFMVVSFLVLSIWQNAESTFFLPSF